LTARAYTAHEFVDGTPLAGSPRSHRFTTAAGRAAPGPSSNRRSSSTSNGMRSGISGRCSTSHDSQPRDEKKLIKITTEDDRNTTRPTPSRNAEIVRTAMTNRDTKTKQKKYA
jgi:hypothetical protein